MLKFNVLIALLLTGIMILGADSTGYASDVGLTVGPTTCLAPCYYDSQTKKSVCPCDGETKKPKKIKNTDL